jgi:phosphatidate phosphatase APP1
MKSFLSKFQKYVLIFIRNLNSIRTDKASPVVLNYTVYGNGSKVRVFGRVVEEIKKYDFSKTKSKLVHFFQVIKLFVTIKHEDAQVEAEIHGQKVTLTTNEEGFFYTVIERDSSNHIKENVAFKIKTLKKNKKPFDQERVFKSPVAKPTAMTKKIIISDIDDTVMQSKATDFTRMALRTLFFTVSHRKSFPDAAKAYKRLEVGPDKDEENLFFYVSSSTWNIYPLIKDFLKINDFPEGVILLQDVAGEKKKKHENSHGHKLDRISEVAEFYEDLKLTLIGDAGQQDPEIYLQIAEKDPSKIDQILIRNTWWSMATDNRQEYLDRAKALGVEMRYFDDLGEI